MAVSVLTDLKNGDKKPTFATFMMLDDEKKKLEKLLKDLDGKKLCVDYSGTANHVEATTQYLMMELVRDRIDEINNYISSVDKMLSGQVKSSK